MRESEFVVGDFQSMNRNVNSKFAEYSLRIQENDLFSG